MISGSYYPDHDTSAPEDIKRVIRRIIVDHGAERQLLFVTRATEVEVARWRRGSDVPSHFKRAAIRTLDWALIRLGTLHEGEVERREWLQSPEGNSALGLLEGGDVITFKQTIEAHVTCS